MNISWTKDSYLKGHEDDEKYQLIKDSTVNYTVPTFDGPEGRLN